MKRGKFHQIADAVRRKREELAKATTIISTGKTGGIRKEQEHGTTLQQKV